MEHLFQSLIRNGEGCTERASSGEASGPMGDSSYKENFYVSVKLLTQISKYLEREPGLLRCDEVWETGWFNKKESYIRKRLKHKRKEGIYCLGISNLCRSFNGERITRYQLFWLYERDVYFINKGLPPEPKGEAVPMDTLTNLYNVIDIDKPEEAKTLS